MAEHETTYLVYLIVALAAFVTEAVLHLMFWFDTGVEYGFVRHTCRKGWDVYDLEIVITDWVFYIWLVVYGLQMLWLVYALAAFARRNPKSKQSFIVDPPLIPSTVYVFFIFGLSGIMGWLILKDMAEYERFSILSIAFCIVCFCVTSALALRAAGHHAMDISDSGLHRELWALRILLHNGITTLTTWVVSITMFTTAHLLSRYQLASKDVAQYVSISIIMAYLVIWCAIDIFLTYHVTDYVFGPYVVTMATFIMLVIKNMHLRSLLFYIGAIFLAISVLLLVLKVSVTVGRSLHRPTERGDAYRHRKMSRMTTSSEAESEMAGTGPSEELANSNAAFSTEIILPQF